MKVLQLRKELKKYGLSTAGNRQEMIDRIISHKFPNTSESTECLSSPSTENDQVPDIRIYFFKLYFPYSCLQVSMRT